MILVLGNKQLLTSRAVPAQHHCHFGARLAGPQTRIGHYVGFSWRGVAPSDRRKVIAHDNISKSSNRYKQLERDLLPGDVPNSPTRRLSHAIKHALSLRKLARLYANNSHKLVWYKDKHTAAMLMRVASLLYYRLVAGQVDRGVQDELSTLLDTLGPAAAKAATVRFIQGPKLCQLLVVVARLGLQPPEWLLDAWCAELLREGGKKLLEAPPDLLAECVDALGLLQWRDAELWRRAAAAARAVLDQSTAAQLGTARGGMLEQQWAQRQRQPAEHEKRPFQQQQQAASAGRAVPAAPAALAAPPETSAATKYDTLPPALHEQLPSLQPPRSFLSRDFAPLARGFAAVGLRDEPLLQVLAAATLQRLSLLSVQEVADIAEAMVKLGSQQPALADAMSVQLVKVLFNSANCEPACVARAVLAVGRLAPQGQQQTKLLAAVARAMVVEGWRLPPDGIVQLLEACAEAGAQQPVLAGRLCRAIAAAAKAGLQGWEPAQLAAAARALSRLPAEAGIEAPAAAAAVQALAAAALDTAAGMDLPELCDVLAACARWGGAGTTALANVAAAAAAARPQELGAGRRAQLLSALKQLGHAGLAAEVALALEAPGRRGVMAGTFD